jgi:hypothetical protein
MLVRARRESSLFVCLVFQVRRWLHYAATFVLRLACWHESLAASPVAAHAARAAAQRLAAAAKGPALSSAAAAAFSAAFEAAADAALPPSAAASSSSSESPGGGAAAASNKAASKANKASDGNGGGGGGGTAQSGGYLVALDAYAAARVDGIGRGVGYTKQQKAGPPDARSLRLRSCHRPHTHTLSASTNYPF